MVEQYRKRPVAVEVMHFEQSAQAPAVASWCGGYTSGYPEFEAVYIPTREGVMRADVGDWVIRGVKGEFYPCKPDIFDMTYEPVESSSKAGKTQ